MEKFKPMVPKIEKLSAKWTEKVVKTEEALRLLSMGQEVCDKLSTEAQRLRGRQKHAYISESKMLEDVLATVQAVK